VEVCVAANEALHFSFYLVGETCAMRKNVLFDIFCYIRMDSCDVN
jgi:hypothetical protein